jgi:cytohesin
MRYAHKPLALPMLLACFIVLLSSATTYALPSFKEFANSDLGKELDSKLQKKITTASDEQTGKKLLEAAKYGDVDIIRKLIAKGADIEVRDEQGFTPLFLAAINGKAEAARVLIEAKAGIDRVEKYNNTPLCYAAMNNHPEVAEILINAGANINVQNIIGDTPLILALKKNAKQVATTLLRNNANPDITNKYNVDAMSLVSKKDKDMQDLILSKSKKLSTRNSDGETPLIKAAWEDDTNKVQALLNLGSDPNAADSRGLTALYWSFRYDNEKMFDLLIQKGADLKRIKNPLFFATANNLMEGILDRLISMGENVTQRDEHLNTVLMEASNARFANTTSYLLEKGANTIINERNDAGGTALSMAVSRNKPYVVQILLDNGADPNIGDNDNSTPLMLSNNPKITKMLLDKGANPNAQTYSGYTALLLTKNPEIIKLLISAGADVNFVNPIQGSTALSHLLISKDNDAESLTAIKYLLDAGANPNVFNKGGCGLAPLFWGIYYNHPEAVRLMLKAGGNPNLPNIKKNNITPLMACSTPAMADILIKAGADINAVDNNGKSVLDYAAEQEDQILFRFLESRGADVDRLNSDGETPLMTAIREGNTIEIKSLIERHADPFAGKESIPFVAAIRLKNSELVSELLKNVKDINAPALGGYTPLTLAVSEQNNIATQQILAKKANVNQSDANGATALGIALVNKNSDLTETLIKAGADVNQVQGGQFTPLFIAATNNDIESMKILLAAGAEANDPGAVYGTVKNNNPQALQLLLDAGADPTIKTEDNKGFLDFAKENKANDVKKVLKSALKKYKNKATK